MARISTYAQDASISADDLLVGSDAEDSNITKNYRIEDLADFVKGYKDYVFSFTQSGTNDPVITQLNNNTGLTFTFTRNSAGVFYLVPSSNIDVNKVWVQATGGHVGNSTAITVKGFTVNRYDIINVDSSGNPADEVDAGFIELRIYP